MRKNYKTHESSKISGRFFIVGCPRSGTTLLQSYIATHSNFISFPESHFFSTLIIPKWSKIFGIASPKAIKQIEKIAIKFDCIYEQIGKARNSRNLKKSVDLFIYILDEIALMHQKENWIEKSPEHLHQIFYMKKLVPKAKFIHIIRNGEDNIASLYSVSYKYPESWKDTQDINRCIDWWVRDAEISSSYEEDKDHYVIKYEELVANPEKSLKSIFKFIGVPFEKNILSEHSRASNINMLIDKHEQWKIGVSKRVVNVSKFNTVFNEKQRKIIKTKLEKSKVRKYTGFIQ